ncbi:MAG: thioredoxin-disulfide reductase [Clostridiales bacterium]|nr:thioredoxin-disulfide reductase [Clostridiales bacterium]
MSEHIYDSIIIGAGPGGLAAGIYAARANLDAIIFEKTYAGGQISTADDVENYPGIASIKGVDFGENLEKHAVAVGAQILYEDVQELYLSGITKKVVTNEKTYHTRTIILAMGAQPRRLGVPGETELRGRGVSYCATCDGAFFRDKDVVVVGGGDTACEEALYLSAMCSKVYVIHRRDQLRARGVIANSVVSHKKIEVVWNSSPDFINAGDVVTGITVRNKLTNEVRQISTSAVFIAVGIVPQTSLVLEQLKMVDGDPIETDSYMRTSIHGVFAIGDIRKTPLRQVVTAAADGAIAVYGVQEYLVEQEFLK